MTQRERFWELLNEVLDERREPLDDASVQQLLGEEPGLFVELERLRARAGELRQARRTARARAGAVAALLALVAGAIAWHVIRHGGANEHPAVDGGAILSFRAEVVVESPEGRTIVQFDGERLRRIREEFLADPRATESSGAGLLAVIDRTSFAR